MIKVTATATIYFISPVMEITTKSGNPFQKRELVLNDSWEKDGVTHPNLVMIEFAGDKMQLLDNLVPGQKVTVEAFVNGREKDGKFFNSIRGASVQPVQQYQQQPVQQYQQPYQPSPGFPGHNPPPGYGGFPNPGYQR